MEYSDSTSIINRLTPISPKNHYIQPIRPPRPTKRIGTLNNNNDNKRFIIQVINNTVQGHKQSKAMYKLPCPLIS